jgi:Sodium:alanine symporter family
MFALTCWIIFRSVRETTELRGVLTPWVSGDYIVSGVMITFLNITDIPQMLGLIMQSAFGPGLVTGGVPGALMAGLKTGTRRGRFSNEAGQGQAPNADAAATTPHPVDQGLAQAFRVFVGTFIICSLSAFVGLLAADDAYPPDGSRALFRAGRPRNDLSRRSARDRRRRRRPARYPCLGLPAGGGRDEGHRRDHLHRLAGRDGAAVTAMTCVTGHSATHSRSFWRLRLSHVRIVLIGTSWCAARSA